ncbi:MAG: FAD-dependent oxidoreductase [Lachnospiraceae bacterium]|nr:FAD-dependent oxidoreductase [Lachnospiraceae bacterium]
MKTLYAPGRIGALEIKNRMVMAPMVDGFGIGGVPSERSLEYFRVRAAGGIGLIVVGNVHVDPEHRHLKPEFHLYEDSFTEKLKPLTEVIHKEGARVFAQLIHQGRYARSSEYEGRVQAVAPSAVFTGMTRETPRELTREEILKLEDNFAQAAGRALKAGFDGVELCANSGYLFGQFLSPLTNKREDSYGGDLESRTLFLTETIRKVKKAVGDKMPVTVRMGGNDFVSGSNTNADACQIACLLEKAGADAISVTGGWHESRVPQVTMDLPHGVFGYLGKNIKQQVKIPVMMGNRMDIFAAERLIEQGDADFAVFGRPILADPEFPRKAAQGRYDAIRPCIGCNQGCLDHSMSGKAIACLGNAECGREYELKDREGLLPTQVRTENPKKLLVIGAGAAGMEFARVAAMQGHKVTIWEKEETYGGQLRLACAPPAREDFKYLADYLYKACVRLGVKFCFNRQASAGELLRQLGEGEADKLVIATGACPAAPPIPSEAGMVTVQAWDVLAGRAETGKEIVVVGGGAVGIETAILMGEEGTLTPKALRFLMLYRAEDPDTLYSLLNRGSKKVTVVEMQDKAGRDIGKTTRWIMLDRLKKLGIPVHTGFIVTEIKKDRVIIQRGKERLELPADTVVLAAGSKPDDSLYEPLREKSSQVFIVGDAKTPGKVMDAIRSAYDLAASIGR